MRSINLLLVLVSILLTSNALGTSDVSTGTCPSGSEDNHCRGYWHVGPRGFLPENKVGASCLNSNMAKFCDTLKTNPTSKALSDSAQDITADMLLSADNEESTIEDSYHTLTIAMCRIGYNQNPSSKAGPPIRIPYHLSKLILPLANALHREPGCSYSSLVLDNCRMLSDSEGFTNGNSYEDWEVQRTITTANEAVAHRAEKGFYASHCAVEKAFAGPVQDLKQIEELLAPTPSIAPSSILTLRNLLRSTALRIRQTVSLLMQMRHFFNTEHFYSELRPLLKCGNMFENGVIFESGANEEQFDILLPNGTSRHVTTGTVIYGIRGPTGAMTSSLAALDAGLQVTTSINADPGLEATMNEFRQYHPLYHYIFNNKLRDLRLRDRVLDTTDLELIDAYNDAVTAISEFRFAHVGHVMTYIMKSVPHMPAKQIKGTGNTPIASYLCRSAVGTLQSRIFTTNEGVKISSRNMPTMSIPSICSRECVTRQYDIYDEPYCVKMREIMDVDA